MPRYTVLVFLEEGADGPPTERLGEDGKEGARSHSPGEGADRAAHSEKPSESGERPDPVDAIRRLSGVRTVSPASGGLPPGIPEYLAELEPDLVVEVEVADTHALARLVLFELSTVRGVRATRLVVEGM